MLTKWGVVGGLKYCFRKRGVCMCYVCIIVMVIYCVLLIIYS